MCGLQAITYCCIDFIVNNFSVINTSCYCQFVHLMPTFDPKPVRIVANALRIIGTSVGSYRGYFGNLCIALWTKKLPTPSAYPVVSAHSGYYCT